MLPRIAGLALAMLLALPAAALAAEPRPATPCRDGAEVCIQPMPVEPVGPVQPVDPGPGGSPIAGHYYYVAAVERGGTAFKIEGKLWIEGDRLGASVGCNSIGARASFDGRTLTVRDIVTTEMACEGHLAEAERTLLGALQAGPFTWTGKSFDGNNVTIQATEAGTTPPTPPDGGTVDPDRPVDKPGDPGVVPLPGLDLEACRAFIPEKEWQAIFGPATGSGGGSGTGSGNVGSGGSGGGSGGSSGGGEVPPVVIDPAPPATPIAEPPPGRPTPAGPGSTPIVDPDPTSTPAPASTPIVDPDPTPAPTAGKPSQKPKPDDRQASDGVTLIAPTTTADQPVAVDLPATVEEGRRLPLETSDQPAPTPSTEACRELLSRIRTLAAGAPLPPAVDGVGEAANATRDMAAAGARGGTVESLLVLVLVLAGGGLMVAWMRTIPGRREQS